MMVTSGDVTADEESVKYEFLMNSITLVTIIGIKLASWQSVQYMLAIGQ